MKKITLLLFTFFIYTIVSSQSERFYRLRSLGTSIDSNEKNIFCSGGNFSFKPLARSNVSSVSPLIEGQIYRVYYDDELKYYWVEQTNSFPSDDTEIYVNENNVTLIDVNCPDSDNDGIPDSQDNCPTQAGPSSNNGCPIPTGNPDLIIDSSQTFIFSDCFNCSSQLSSLGSRRHEINNQSGILNISTLSVKNIGNGLSSGTDIQYYVSSNTTLDTSDFKPTASTTSINSINAGSSSIKSKILFATDFGSPGRFNGSWYILIVVDDSKTNNETNETNNVTAIPITFTDPFGKSSGSASRSINLTTKLSLGQLSENKSYPIEIFNFQGQKVLSKKVLSPEEENQASLELPRGFYIIKSENGDRKVYID